MGLDFASLSYRRGLQVVGHALLCCNILCSTKAGLRYHKMLPVTHVPSGLNAVPVLVISASVQELFVQCT